ncbi:ATP-binding protein [Nocardioides pocheonensis]|uniref:ATP-binding protein n=1 Tax=Nocardioides pocheonensis TaxID=661485 RepID=UPI00160F5C98|nr:BTAD domain-containing putative transcriptional regulator [Nocardioides pocheonensis]
MAALSVRVLGEFSIDGLDVGSLADRKARQLLRWLALAGGRAVSTTALADALWGDVPPARPADQVAVLASRLRRALGADSIVRGDDGYRLAYDWLDLDELGVVVAEAERRHREGKPTGAVAAARIALALVRGPIPPPTTDAEWVRADHAAAEQLVRRARRVAASAMLDTDDWLDALDLAAADARADPYDEDAVRLVMRANALGGRPAIALAAYADLRKVLAEDLGSDPAPATAALHETILRGELAPPATARSRPEARLVGRGSQLAHLDALADRAAEGPTRVAVVVGEAGIGKSTLLATWSRARAALGDTVLFGTCGPLERSAPLDALLVAVAEHLRRSDDPDALLGEDAAVLAPLLGLERDPARVPVGTMPLDPALGVAGLFAAITGLLGRIAGDRAVVVVIDDAHLAGPALADWIAFAARRTLRLLVVTAVRPAETAPIRFADLVNVGPLDRSETAELVGSERADALYERSGGHPLFLTELVRAPTERLPASLIAAVDELCDQLGPAADLLRTAAVLGAELDVDLLSSVVGRPPLDVLADVERAEARDLLVEQSGRYAFRHELVREALAAGSRSARVALLHREAAAALHRRPDADPVAVAEHARLGGDLPLAAQALRTAALRAAERFDHATAERLLDESLRLVEDYRTRMARARVRIRRGRYAEAEADVDAASDAGAEGNEVRSWAAYFDRRFDDAVAHAREGELAASDPALRARCLIVGGRTLHARGELAEAERLLSRALEVADGPDRVTAAAWLGVLQAHRSRPEEAIDLLRPATRPGIGADQTSATLHALLFTGHAHALAGRPAQALATFAHYTEEVERRQVPRFGGRGVNFGGWVLRNVGARDAAVDAHQEALACADGDGTPEVRIAALEDLAEDRLTAADPDAAAALLATAGEGLMGDLVFGWRLEMKHTLLRARVALQRGALDDAVGLASGLAAGADQVGVPRYAATARLLVHQATAAAGEPVDLDAAWRDLGAVEGAVALEAWWWAGETGAALRQQRWIDRAELLASRLADAGGARGDSLRADASRRLEDWRLRVR